MLEQSLILATTANSLRVAIGAASAQSAVIGSNTAQLCSTVDCFVLAGTNPTALADGTCQFIPAGLPIPFKALNPAHKVAVIGAGSSGYLYITPWVVQ